MARVLVLPSRWALPRSFRFEKRGGRRLLKVDSSGPPTMVDSVESVGRMEWRVTLRCSKEALGAAAYDMTFWFM